MATRATYTSLSDYVALLRGNRQFLLLWLGEVRDLSPCISGDTFGTAPDTRVTQIANQFGNWFNFVACFKLVQDLTGQVGIALSAVVVVRCAPRLLWFVVAGGVVDSFNRAHVMIAAALLQALVVLALPLVQVTRSIWCASGTLLVRVAAAATLQQLTMPRHHAQAAVRADVPAVHLQDAVRPREERPDPKPRAPRPAAHRCSRRLPGLRTDGRCRRQRGEPLCPTDPPPGPALSTESTTGPSSTELLPRACNPPPSCLAIGWGRCTVAATSCFFLIGFYAVAHSTDEYLCTSLVQLRPCQLHPPPWAPSDNAPRCCQLRAASFPHAMALVAHSTKLDRSIWHGQGYTIRSRFRSSRNLEWILRISGYMSRLLQHLAYYSIRGFRNTPNGLGDPGQGGAGGDSTYCRRAHKRVYGEHLVLIPDRIMNTTPPTAVTKR
jgi:hypothetical protein